MTRNDLLTISQRLREYKDNPHHINPMSESFGRLIVDAADALSKVAGDYAAQPAPDAASQAEEGREALEVVGHLLLGGPVDQDELEDNDIDLDMKIVERLQSELVTKGEGVILALMTVAQHERIVADLLGKS